MKILVSDPLSPEGLQKLEEGAWVDVRTDQNEEELEKIIGDYDALFVRSGTKVTASLIEKGEKLQVIGRAGVGVDNIDVDKATEKGIMVINAPEGNTTSTAEHTIAMMASLARNIPPADSSMREKKWERKKYTGVELNGKVLGLFGFGRIGSEVARRARAMGMKIIVHDPYVSTERAQKLGVEAASKEEVLQRADFISLHMPKNKSTLHFIGKEELEMVKPEARIINCARGGLLDEDALAEALREGKVAGAALDVFEEEPLGESPLRELENVVLTPHLAASTEEAQVNVAVQVAEQGLKALQGEPVVSAVNVPSLPPEVLNEVKPYLPLMRLLGSFYIQLYGGKVKEVELRYSGEIADVPAAPLTTSCLIGMLQVIVGDEVNYVNAPHIAKSRGIRVRETTSRTIENYASLVTLTVKTEEETHSIAGTLFNENDMRIVRIGDYSIDVTPSRYMLVCSYIDRPGIIGKLGTMLGNEDINIASMQVGREFIGGEAVMVLQVDDVIPKELLNKVKVLDGIVDTRFVELQGKDLHNYNRNS